MHNLEGLYPNASLHSSKLILNLVSIYTKAALLEEGKSTFTNLAGSKNALPPQIPLHWAMVAHVIGCIELEGLLLVTHPGDFVFVSHFWKWKKKFQEGLMCTYPS